jgi:hypothetical protein
MGAYENGGGDCNNNGIPDAMEPDSDGDGIIDACDVCPNIPSTEYTNSCTVVAWSAGNGQWSAPSNWMPSPPPGGPNNAPPTLYCVSITPGVTVQGPTSSLTIESLVLGAPTGSDNTLNIKDTLTVNQCTTINASGLFVLGPDQNATLAGGTVQIASGGEIKTGDTGTPTRILDGTIINHGTVRCTTQLDVNGPQFTNAGATAMDKHVAESAAIIRIHSASVIQQGIIEAQGNASIRVFDAPLVNQSGASISLIGATLAARQGLTNQSGGVISGSGGQIDANITNSGTISFNNTLILNGSVDNEGGQMSCTGPFTITGGSTPFSVNVGQMRLAPSGGVGSLTGTTMQVAGSGLDTLGAVAVGGAAHIQLSGDMAIHPYGLYQADPMSATTSGVLTAANVQVNCQGQMLLSDQMHVMTGDLLLDGISGLECDPEGGPTTPVLEIENNAQLTVSGDWIMNGSVTVQDSSALPVILGGDFVNESSLPSGFQFNSNMQMNSGGMQMFEVGGADLGAGLGGLSFNFALDALEITTGTNVQFADAFDNSQTGQSPCSEALYLRRLTLHNGSLATLNACHVYVGQFVNENPAGMNGSYGIMTTGCGRILRTGDVNGDGAISLADYSSLPGCLNTNQPWQSGLPCTGFDLNADGTVNLADVAVLQRVFTGP